MAPHHTVDEIELRIGQQVRALRKRKRLTQSELARDANVSVGTIRNLETGAGSTLTTLVSVTRALGRTDWLNELAPPISVSPMALLKSADQANEPRR